MQELRSDPNQALYQSQWWTRLAAFTENAKKPAMSGTLQFVVIAPEESVTGNTRQTKVSRTFRKKGGTSVGKALAFLVRSFTIKSEVLTNSQH